MELILSERHKIPNVDEEVAFIEKFKSSELHKLIVAQKIERLKQILAVCKQSVVHPWPQTKDEFILPFRSLPKFLLQQQTRYICLHVEVDPYATAELPKRVFVTDGRQVREILRGGSHWQRKWGDWLTQTITQQDWDAATPTCRVDFESMLKDAEGMSHLTYFDFFGRFGTMQIILRQHFDFIPTPIRDIIESYAWEWKPTFAKRNIPVFYGYFSLDGRRGNCFHSSTKLTVAGHSKEKLINIEQVKEGDEIMGFPVLGGEDEPNTVVFNRRVDGDFTFVHIFDKSGNQVLAVTPDHLVVVVMLEITGCIPAGMLVGRHEKFRLLSTWGPPVEIGYIEVRQDTVKYHLTTSTSLVQVYPNILVTTLCDVLE